MYGVSDYISPAPSELYAKISNNLFCRFQINNVLVYQLYNLHRKFHAKQNVFLRRLFFVVYAGLLGDKIISNIHIAISM